MRLAPAISNFMITASVVFMASTAVADPCGMVPPIDWAAQSPTIHTDKPTPIKRVGAQRTYVFYRNGLETLVLRPGFQGNVDEFGMLIPFPSPPAVRKVPDNVFEQIAAAIDPPEVVVDLRPQEGMYGGGGFGGGGFGGGGGGFGGGGLGFEIQKDEVRVIREEAVGMYEVAVLAAGSDQALKRWMEDHKFVYPSGMEAVCPDYIEQRWCFVAVKTKVKQKRASDPRPGQRSIDNALPADAKFDGHVQAMGFRFRTPELVVPMRLSVHNSTKLHNVVYLLSDTPSKLRHIPEEFVRRQISGFKLYDRMTKPLPLRILGGTFDDIPRATRIQLARDRDPEPHNGVAAELFASDLLAARTKRLESKSEAHEKDLFAINEALDLRGPDVDKAVQRQLRRTRTRMTQAALKLIEDMTLTVIDGDFPRDVLARENLTFAKYQMPLHKSNRSHYDANKVGRLESEVGELYASDGPSLRESVPPIDSEMQSDPVLSRTSSWSWMALLIGAVGAIAVVTLRLPKHRRIAAIGCVVLLLLSTQLVAVDGDNEKIPTLHLLIKRLGDPATAELTAEQLGKYGPKAVPALLRQARSPDIVTRGWAIVALGRIGDQESKQYLKRLHDSESVTPIVQTWAAAALIQAADDTKELEAFSQIAAGKPELNRPLVLSFQRLSHELTTDNTVDSLLALGHRIPTLKQAVSDLLSSEHDRAELDKYLLAQPRHRLVSLANHYPELTDPIATSFCKQVQTADGVDHLEARLIVAGHSSVLASSMTNDVLAAGSKSLLDKMLQSKEISVRQTAAGYVATLGQAPAASQSIAAEVANAFNFDASAKQTPWHNGPLFIPNIPWDTDTSQALVENLIRWHLWAERNADRATQRQIDTNLRSVTLAQNAGYSIPVFSNTATWLEAWKQIAGAEGLKQLLAEQDSETDYARLLSD